jgi:histidine ammonia-lyase
LASVIAKIRHLTGGEESALHKERRFDE